MIWRLCQCRWSGNGCNVNSCCCCGGGSGGGSDFSVPLVFLSPLLLLLTELRKSCGYSGNGCNVNGCCCCGGGSGGMV